MESMEIVLQVSQCIIRIIQAGETRILQILYRLKTLSVLCSIIEKQQSMRES